MTSTNQQTLNALNLEPVSDHDLLSNYDSPSNHDLPRIGAATSPLHAGLDQHHSSAASWSAIFAGAAAAAALSLILLLLGTGLGLSSVAPWPLASGSLASGSMTSASSSSAGITAAAFGLSAILWLTFTQIVASGMGGYLAGRLRNRWVGAAADEVYFRDTAHGFLTWAVATLATAVLLTSVVSSIIGGGLQAGAAVAGGALNATTNLAAVASGSKDSGDVNPMTYYANTLFRKTMDANAAAGSVDENSANEATQASTLAEITTIMASAIANGDLPTADIQYVGQLVSERTGLNQIEAEKRVLDTYAIAQTKLRNAEILAKQAADKVRKASAYMTLWLFISLLMGAFAASWAATFGGRCRDY